MKHFLAYYQLANDYDRRNELHAQPLQPVIEKVESLQSFDELNEQFRNGCWIHYHCHLI